jgi:hypothetical protein
MPDFVASVVTYLNNNLNTALGASPSKPKVYADAAPKVDAPYIVLHDTDEHYRKHSTGELLVTGHIVLNIKSHGKTQARSIGLAAIWSLMSGDAAGLITFDEGVLEEIVPASGHSAPLTEVPLSSGPPYAAERTIVFKYVIRYTPA